MRLRVSTVQFEHRPLPDFQAFATQVTADVTFAQDAGSRLIVFPEYLSGCLLTIPGTPAETLAAWDHWTQPYLDLFSHLAQTSGLYILGGTHLTRDGDQLYNVAYLFTPSGQVHTQRKLHLTPCEVTPPWALGTGQEVTVFDTDLGKLAVLVCFDVEFPEAARAACDAGADILLVPSCTDDRAGFWRVRHCAHARTVENQVYVIHSALVGGLPTVRYLEQSWGKAGILSPCDLPFAHDGIVAEGEWNRHAVICGDVDLDRLAEVRQAGSVTPRLHRRPAYTARTVTVR